MSHAHIEQFYSKVAQNPALAQKLLSGTKDADEFLRNAVAEGKAQGFDFTFEEADAWVKNQQRLKASGELSETQLESVAGGKTQAQNQHIANSNEMANLYFAAANDTSVPLGTRIEAGLTGAMWAVEGWLSSW